LLMMGLTCSLIQKRNETIQLLYKNAEHHNNMADEE
jgi:hypothetical protein